jgi:hypothetical protein
MKVSKLAGIGLMIVGGIVVVTWVWNTWGPGAGG